MKLSIVTPTLNNEKDIKKFLLSLRRQSFPRREVEVLVMDGGSQDKTRVIAKEFGAVVIDNPDIYADAGVNLGLEKANGELIMVLAVDNIYRERTAIEKMVRIFMDENVYAAFPKPDSSKEDNIFTKYVNTFTDPFSHFVYQDSANPRTFKKKYKTIQSNEIFDIYDFTSHEDLPLIAFAQGFTIRKGFKRASKSKFDDLMPVLELIRQGKLLAYVHSVSLDHYTIDSLPHFFYKQAWRTKNMLEGKRFGINLRMETLSKNQRLRVKLWPVYAFSFVAPLIRSLYGTIADKEILWLAHPFLCFISASASLLAFSKYYVGKK